MVPLITSIFLGFGLRFPIDVFAGVVRVAVLCFLVIFLTVLPPNLFLGWDLYVSTTKQTKLLITAYLTLPGIYHLIIHSFKIRMQTAEFYQIYELNMIVVLNFQLKELFQFLHSKNLIMKLSKNCNFSLLLFFLNVYNIEDIKMLFFEVSLSFIWKFHHS